MSADKEQYAREAQKCLSQMREDYYPASFEKSLLDFKKNIALGGLILVKLITEDEIEVLRKEKHMNAVFEVLKHMVEHPEPVGSPAHEFRMKEIREEMTLGKFKEAEFREKYQRRECDPLNPVIKAELQLKLMNGLKGTPRFNTAGPKALEMKGVARDCIKQLRHLQSINQLFPDNYKPLIDLFRKAMQGGFSKEELKGGSWFSLEDDIGITREELDSLNPNNPA